MKIEPGKYYRTRDGKKVGPMYCYKPDSDFGWAEVRQAYGRWGHDGEDGDALGPLGGATSGDIVAEWIEAPQVDLTTITTPYGLRKHAHRALGGGVEMTDYNDGKWHGWNGGECPVHPRSTVEPIWLEGRQGKGSLILEAERVSWGGKFDVPVAFRVIKEHREPRKWWLIEWGDGEKTTAIRDGESEAEISAAWLRGRGRANVNIIPVIEKLP
jgi:hypothetical protein